MATALCVVLASAPADAFALELSTPLLNASTPELPALQPITLSPAPTLPPQAPAAASTTPSDAPPTVEQAAATVTGGTATPARRAAIPREDSVPAGARETLSASNGKASTNRRTARPAGSRPGRVRRSETSKRTAQQFAPSQFDQLGDPPAASSPTPFLTEFSNRVTDGSLTWAPTLLALMLMVGLWGFVRTRRTEQ